MSIECGLAGGTAWTGPPVAPQILSRISGGFWKLPTGQMKGVATQRRIWPGMAVSRPLPEVHNSSQQAPVKDTL